MTYTRPPGGPPPRFEGQTQPGERGTGPTRPPPRRPPPRHRPSPVVLGLVYGGIGLLALAVATVTFVIMSPPTDLIRREMVAQVKNATGRDLTIAGPASFTLFPTLGLSISDVSLSAPPAMGGEALLTASSFDIGVRLLPLLRQEIVVDRLVLHEPVFALRVDKDGRRSWNMALRENPQQTQLAQAGDDKVLTDFAAGSAGTEAPASGLRDISGLSLGDIRIVDGTIRYRDDRSGSGYTLEAVNAEAGLELIARPLDAKGSFVWSREKIDFDGTLTSPQELLQEQPAKLAFNISGRPVMLSYDGSVAMRDGVETEGAVKGTAASLRALASWLGTELPRAPGFRDVSFAGNLRAGGSAARLSDAKLTLDGATATGTIAVATSGARPSVVADLKVANLDLANYVAGAESAAPSPAAAPPPAAAAPPSSDPQSIEDLLDSPGPRVKGYTQRSGWRTEPIDLAVLRLADVEAKLSVAALSYGAIRVDASELAVALKDRVLKTTFQDVRLYQGRGTGFLTIEDMGSEAAIAANFNLAGIAAEALLKDAADINWLGGKGDVTLALSGRGPSQAAIVQSLSGKADIAVNNGAIIGFNLAGAMRDLSAGKIPKFESSPTEKTDFSELTGSFLITNGIAANNDLKLASPLLRATGAGTVNLPARSLDYTLRPKVVASISGQGGPQDLSGLEIPVRITGPWDDPAIEPDISGAINNPGAMEAVKEIGKQLKGKDAGEIVDDLFGKKTDGEPSKAERLLQKFLGK